MKYKLRQLSIPLVRLHLPEDQIWFEMETKGGRGPYVWIYINPREKRRGRPPGRLVAGGRRISLRKKPGRVDWSKRLVEWRKKDNFWLWTDEGPHWKTSHVIE